MYGSVAMTAATSWPWNRTLSVTSTAWVSPDMVGIQARLCWAMSSPVTTAITPGTAEAREASMPLILAWAYGLRRIAMWSMPGQLDVVDVIALAPRMNRSSSTLR